MPKLRDLTGQTFGNVFVINRAQNKRVSKRTTFVMWNCVCLLCGKKFISKGNNLTSGNTTSCGCRNAEAISKAQLEDLTGRRFGRWTVKERVLVGTNTDKSHKTKWKCVCDCGIEKIILADKLKNGESKSCGCYKREESSKRLTSDLTGMRFGHLVALRRITPPGEQVKWECLCDCGNFVNVAAASLKKGLTQSCGCRKFSIGAEKVALALKDNGIKYKDEYKFKDLYAGNHHYLRFDFAIQENKKLLALIEYQGQQHYEERINPEFGKVQREITDPMKREYCRKHKIPLFEIRYDDNIEEKVNSILINLNLKHVNPVPSSFMEKV